MKNQSNTVCTGPAPNLYIHSSAFRQKADGGLVRFSSLAALHGERQQLFIWWRCTFVDPISFCAVAETVEKLVALSAPYCGRASCDSAQILSITVAPLSD